MKIIKIKQEKQDNGLWGTPFNCKYIKDIPIDNRKMIIFSAAIAAINEKFNRPFSIVYSNDYGFKFRIGDTNDSFGNYYSIMYHKYEVVDNILYEFESEQEHITFLRKHKLDNLEKWKV
jgi:hypothetical protein